MKNLRPSRLAMLACVLAGAFVVLARGAAAGQPLVDATWVRAHLGAPGVVFLDTRSDPKTYLAGHIPGAVHTDYAHGGWRVTRDGVMGLLPTEQEAETVIGDLGIENTDHVVLLPAGTDATEMGIATRIYWTFKVFGHDDVSILDGGMKAWLGDAANPLSTQPVTPDPTIFTVELRRDLLATEADVRQAAGGSVLVDNRTPAQYAGKEKAKPVARTGTIPGAVNAPAMWATRSDSGVFRDREALAKIYASAGVPADKPVITFCNTGHWASVGWFVTSELLGRPSRLYDASMVEWAKDQSNPVIMR